MRSAIMIGLSIATLLIGSAVIVFTAGVMRRAMQNDSYLLMRDYDPNGQAADQPSERYGNLYTWTEHLIHQRNHYGLAFHYTLGASCIIAGLATIAWAVDRERLRRRTRGGIR